MSSPTIDRSVEPALASKELPGSPFVSQLLNGSAVEPRGDTDLEDDRKVNVPQFLLLHVCVGVLWPHVANKNIPKLNSECNEASKIEQDEVVLDHVLGNGTETPHPVCL